jgi:hypothetical protein
MTQGAAEFTVRAMAAEMEFMAMERTAFTGSPQVVTDTASGVPGARGAPASKVRVIIHLVSASLAITMRQVVMESTALAPTAFMAYVGTKLDMVYLGKLIIPPPGRLSLRASRALGKPQ